MSFNIPNTFVAGTKARADEVNENFASLEDAVNKSNQALAQVKEDLSYVTNDLLDDFVAEAEMVLKSGKSKFCINSSNLSEDGDSPDILSANQGILSFKIGGEYPIMIATNAYGDSETFEGLDDIDVSGYPDGTYNIFLDLSGNVELLNTKVYRSPKAPTGMLLDDVWLCTLEPWAAYKYNGVSWINYEAIPIGAITVASGQITQFLNGEFNTQYLDADCRCVTQKGRENLSKRYETSWFQVMPKNVYTFEHNFNKDPLHYRARIVCKVKEDRGNFKKGDIIESLYSNYAGNEASTEMGILLKFDENTVTIGIGNGIYHCMNDLGGNGYGNTVTRALVSYKVIVTEDVN